MVYVQRRVGSAGALAWNPVTSVSEINRCWNKCKGRAVEGTVPFQCLRKAWCGGCRRNKA